MIFPCFPTSFDVKQTTSVDVVVMAFCSWKFSPFNTLQKGKKEKEEKKAKKEKKEKKAMKKETKLSSHEQAKLALQMNRERSQMERKQERELQKERQKERQHEKSYLLDPDRDVDGGKGFYVDSLSSCLCCF